MSTRQRLVATIAYWRTLRAGTKGQARLIRQTLAELESRLAVLGGAS